MSHARNETKLGMTAASVTQEIHEHCRDRSGCHGRFAQSSGSMLTALSDSVRKNSDFCRSKGFEGGLLESRGAEFRVKIHGLQKNKSQAVSGHGRKNF